MGAPLLAAHRLEDDRLLELVIDAPPGNVLTGALMAELEEHVAAAARRPALKLVAIRGAGKHFSFGASIEEHRAGAVTSMLPRFHRLIRAVARSEVPVAAVVDGRCLGGAFELALACHLVLATPRAIFACPEVKLGVFPPALAALGPLRLGAALAERLLLTGTELDAAGAQRAGLVSFVAGEDVPPAELAARWFREALAPLSAFTLRQAAAAAREQPAWRQALDEGLGAAERRYLEALVPSHDGNEGIEAFLARRPPVWRDA